MNNEVVNECFNCINEAQAESELLVLEAMVNNYDKYSTIIENCNSDIDQFDFMIQEGKVLDEVNKKSKKDKSKFESMIKFIPRLLIALANLIKAKLDESMGDAVSDFGKRLDEIKDMEAKKIKVADVNRRLKGEAECYIDEKTGKIKFVKDQGSTIGKAAWLMSSVLSITNLMDRIKGEFDLENPSAIRSFVDDIDAVIHGNKDVKKYDLFEGGFKALGSGLGHIASLSGVIATTAKVVEEKANDARYKNMIKDDENVKFQESMKNVSDLSKKLTELNAVVAGVVGSLSLIVKFTTEMSSHGKTIYDDSNEYWDKTYDFFIDRDDLKNKNPQNPNETNEAYRKRLESIVANNVSLNDINKKHKEIKKTTKQQKKEKAKEEYNKKKEQRRTNNSSNTDNH